MKTFSPSDISTRDFYSHMVGAVVPRPIAFVSSVSAEGKVNLSPYSFFNAVSANPPTLIFAPVNSIRDGSTKNTLDNVLEHQEVVINIVNYRMVEQMSLASTPYAKGINEFTKAGLEEAPSSIVEPPRVAEAPIAFECKVKQVIALGKEGGAGNLVICEVLLMHINEGILGAEGNIDPHKLDAVGRMGGSYYCRASGEAIFETLRPLREQGMGVDQLPEAIRKSKILTGSDLAQLANIAEVPQAEVYSQELEEPEIQRLFSAQNTNSEAIQDEAHRIAQRLLTDNEVYKAWAVLIRAHST